MYIPAHIGLSSAFAKLTDTRHFLQKLFIVKGRNCRADAEEYISCHSSQAELLFKKIECFQTIIIVYILITSGKQYQQGISINVMGYVIN